MLTVVVENFGDIAVVECKGRIVRSDAAFKLRNAVLSQLNARIVVLDLTDVSAVEGGGLGMIWFLQRWAQDHEIQLKVFNPTDSVKARLADNPSMPQCEISTFEEMVVLLAYADADSRYGMAA